MAIAWLDDGTHHRVNLTTSGTYTIEDIYQYLYGVYGDETAMSKTGSVGAYTYQFNVLAGELYQQIYVGSGTTLHFQEGETLIWDWPTTSTTDWRIYVYENGILQMDAGSSDDGGVGTYRRGRWGILGDLFIYGTEANPVNVSGFRDIYFYMNEEIPSRAWDVNWVTFREPTYSSSYFYTAGSTGSESYEGYRMPHSFKHLTFDGTNSGTDGWAYWYCYADMTNWIWEDCTFDNMQNGYFRSGCGGAKFERCTFKNFDDVPRHLETGSETMSKHYRPSREAQRYDYVDANQPIWVYKDCIFDSQDAGVYAIYGRVGATILLENCEFINQSTQIYNIHSNILIYGEPTFTSCTKNYLESTGSFFGNVRMLTITVNDPDGNPLENAMVSLRQKEGKEYWQFKTDSNGQVLRHDDEGIFLVEKEEVTQNVYTQWSDGVGDRVHEIMVSHPDYPTHKEEIAMTEDKVRTVTMSNVGGTVIYDSTLYDTVVY